MTFQTALRVVLAAVILAFTLVIAANLASGTEEFAGKGSNIPELANDTTASFSGKASGSGR